MNIFKKNKNKVIEKVNSEVNNENELNIKLAFSDEENARISDVQKQFMEEELNSFSQIQPNEIKVDAVYFAKVDNKLETKVFIRNGLNNEMNFDNITLTVINGNKQIVAKQEFDLRHLGNIPPLSAKVTKLYFDKENILLDDKDYDKYKICFNTDINAFESLDVEIENFPDEIDIEGKYKYNQYLKQLPRLEHNTASLSGVNVIVDAEGKLIITVIARNGYSTAIDISELPIAVLDSSSEEIAKGMFKLNDFKISSHKAKIMNFIFNKENLIKQEFDLSSWKVKFNL